MIFPKDGPAYDSCDELKALGGEARVRSIAGEEVRYVLFRGQKAKATLLFFHGNGGTVCYRALHAKDLKSPDWDLVMLEYPGYGGDPKAPTQERILANSLAAFDLFSADHPKWPILVFGKSLGSGPATYLSSLRPVAALVDQTPYPSISEVGEAKFPFIPIGLLNKSPFPARDWAEKVSCPVLVLHGTDDEVIPFRMGAEQAKRFPRLESFEIFQGAHHTDMPFREGERYWGTILAFLHRHLGGGPIAVQ